MRKHNYLVGYEGEGQCIYGKRIENMVGDFVDLFTFASAKKQARKLISRYGNKISRGVIYKLVKVK